MPGQPRRVFVSHGHDYESLDKLRTFLREGLGVQAVVLRDVNVTGLTIIEKLERTVAQCDFAVVLFTGDDETNLHSLRARQNVVHELGFLQGSLGRNKVLLCKQKGVESFSNISGLIYAEFPKGCVEAVFDTVRQSIEKLDAQPFGSMVPVTDAEGNQLAKKVLESISGHESGEFTQQRLRYTFDKLTADLNAAHLSSTDKIRRIRKRLQEFIADGKRALEQPAAPPSSETPTSPVGAALGAALVSSVQNEIRTRHAIFVELEDDLAALERLKASFTDVMAHLRKVLLMEHG